MIDNSFSFFGGKIEEVPINDLDKTEPGTEERTLAAFNEAILDCCRNNNIETVININSTPFDIDLIFKRKEQLLEEYAKRKSIAPDVKTAIEMMIEYFRDTYLDYAEKAEVEPDNEKHLYSQYFPNNINTLLIIIVYSDLLSGGVKQLHNYRQFYIPDIHRIYMEDPGNVFFQSKEDNTYHFLNNIAIAAALAQVLPLMNEEVMSLNTNPSIPNAVKVNKKAYQKIEWLGNQKQLSELFIELKKKGWIEGFNKSFTAIRSCSTKSQTIDVALRPTTNKTRENGEWIYEDTYDNVYTPKYKPMFFGIKEKAKTDAEGE